MPFNYDRQGLLPLDLLRKAVLQDLVPALKAPGRD